MKKAKKDMCSMLAFMLLSSLVYWVFIPSQIKLAKNAVFSNRTFPQFTMAIIFIAATVGFIEAAFRYKKAKSVEQPSASETKFDLASNKMPLLGFAVILAYALSFHYLSLSLRGYGFIISTIIFIPVFFLILKCKNWKYYAAAYAFAAGMYIIFKYILHVALR